MDIIPEKGDQSVYERCSGTMPEKAYIVAFEMCGDPEDSDREEIGKLLETLDAYRVGKCAYLVKTKLTASQIVESFRHFFLVDEYVSAISTCGEFDWCGPRFVGKFLNAYGVRIQQREEIPRPVHPDSGQQGHA
jgi:hypothetical protein